MYFVPPPELAPLRIFFLEVKKIPFVRVDAKSLWKSTVRESTLSTPLKILFLWLS